MQSQSKISEVLSKILNKEKLNKIENEDFTFSHYPQGPARFHYSTESSKKIADYFQSRIEKLL